MGIVPRLSPDLVVPVPQESSVDSATKATFSRPSYTHLARDAVARLATAALSSAQQVVVVFFGFFVVCRIVFEDCHAAYEAAAAVGVQAATCLSA